MLSGVIFRGGGGPPGRGHGGFLFPVSPPGAESPPPLDRGPEGEEGGRHPPPPLRGGEPTPPYGWGRGTRRCSLLRGGGVVGTHTPSRFRSWLTRGRSTRILAYNRQLTLLLIAHQ